MVYRNSENLTLCTRICIVSLLFCTGFSTEERSAFNSDRRRVEAPLIKSSDLDPSAAVFSVDSYGAKGNGVSDDSQAFLAAWNAACTSSSDSIFLVPHGNSYLVKPISFNGPCNTGSLTAQISGRIVAPADPCNWNPEDRTIWLQFSKVQGLTIHGGGIIDGSGEKWWAGSCSRDQNKVCLSVPFAFVVNSSSNVHLRDLTFQNSQKFHVVISLSKHVEVENLQIVAPGDSPNTDGIHIFTSEHVMIRNCTIATGDDCVSIIAQSSHIQVNDIICGPGHGISIGSLGKYNATDTVSDVVVNRASLSGTQNGLRIKTWQGGSGYAQGIIFQHVKMINVSNPIIIDQYYCAGSSRCNQPAPCNNQTSAVQVNNVTYTGITGTSATQEAIKLACSATVPCTNIVLEDISLQLNNGDTPSSLSANVQGSSTGQVIPPVHFSSPSL
uniref:Polygalacturonase n=1 Tax=Picea sitchensis TaxID=3332 RepID=C0PQB8_PICSI|nr:unknown [Picea sitchensis]